MGRKDKSKTFSVRLDKGRNLHGIDVIPEDPFDTRASRKIKGGKRLSSKNVQAWIVCVTGKWQCQLSPNLTGQETTQFVLGIMGIREWWYFALGYDDKSRKHQLLSPSKPLKKHKFLHSSTSPGITLRVLVELYPQRIDDLIQNACRHYFFVHTRQCIMSEQIHCSADVAILLASFSVQAEHGDYHLELDSSMIQKEQLLPQRVLHRHQLSAGTWERKVIECYKQHIGLSRDDAEREYLLLASKLEMFGITYFRVSSDVDERLWIGIDTLGLNIYAFSDRLHPRRSLAWKQITKLTYRRELFVIYSVDDQTPLVFRTDSKSACQRMLELCQSNHTLCIQRNGPMPRTLRQLSDFEIHEQKRHQAEKDNQKQRFKANRELQDQCLQLSEQLANLRAVHDAAMKEAKSVAGQLADKLELAENEVGTLLKEIDQLKANPVESSSHHDAQATVTDNHIQTSSPKQSPKNLHQLQAEIQAEEQAFEKKSATFVEGLLDLSASSATKTLGTLEFVEDL